MFITIFLLSLSIVAISVLVMGIKILFSKKGQFPDSSVSGNKALRRKKIYCIKTEQVIIDKNYKRKDGGGEITCSGC